MRVLVVENDIGLAEQLVAAFETAGYCVDVAFDGEEGQFLGETEPYDAVILDIGLPKVDGLTVLGHWRRNGQTMPVLVLTARRMWSEKVAGFDAGCDDYLTKPFHIEEMLARVRCLIRRAEGHAKPVLECGPMRFDTRTSRVSAAGKPVELTANELKVFSYLIHHQNQVVSRSELIEHIYAQDFDRDSNTIEVFVARLRKKLGADLIQTRKGLGYCLSVPESAA